ncbi:MAG: alpha/beta hydrolase [Planctomycetota bacterium]
MRKHFLSSAILTIVLIVVAFCASGASAQSPIENSGDRVFLVSSRHLPDGYCRASPWDALRYYQVGPRACRPMTADEYVSSIQPARPVVFYVHGNRMPSSEILRRANSVRQQIRCRVNRPAIDWVIFSWPSSKTSLGIRDFREKADRSETDAIFLADLIRKHAERGCTIALVGYSFGARVATGSLHVLAGGVLKERHTIENPLFGANISVGLIAPALESSWLGKNGYHGLATRNMHDLTLLYNRRDAVLKRYWLLEKVRRETALGFSGPTCFAPRFDGSRLPVRSRDCSPSVKLRHAELDYYESRCNAGCDLARMINAVVPATPLNQCTLNNLSAGD